MINQCYLADCMNVMKKFKDKEIDLCIADPPYGIFYETKKYFLNGQIGQMMNEASRWDKIPDKKYFDELFRISINQIICGGNYFLDFLPATRCLIVWDKIKPEKVPFADAEILWTNFDKPVRIFRYGHLGWRKCKVIKIDGKAIHPTQKPVALYKWLLKNYAKPGQTIFDSHVGSGSIRLACHDMGFDFLGCEIDKDYWPGRLRKNASRTTLDNKSCLISKNTRT